MSWAESLDLDAIAGVCRAHGVERLRLFGSATSSAFDPIRSDVDFFVDFADGQADLFDSYFGLKEDLEHLIGRPVDLVMPGAVTNPYFAESAFASSQELYAA